MSAADPTLEVDWTGEDATIAEIERELARLRYESSADSPQPNLRTSVMTHIAWVPQRWKGQAEETLAGMAERHPSRTLLLFPAPDEDDGLDARLSIRCFPVSDRAVCGEVIELTLRGERAEAPASIVLPLLISDLPVFCRWRGEPPFGAGPFEQLVDIVDRLIVDSSEWDELRYDELGGLFGRAAVSDIAWARTEDWRRELAGYWPGIREQEIRIRGPRAEAELVRGWLNARLDRAVRPTEPASALAVRLGGEDVPPPGEEPATPSDLLSAELDNFARNPIYEAAVLAAAGL
ncbi:MAG TPA: glucose-6-phosphate dehydrogenase assembly protein OpcA [Gaiellaceae bacterium]|nr:glucose-6-phosphate dehydrogenase assembly protein OpcA [Gaiellaceae bacterium]